MAPAEGHNSQPAQSPRNTLEDHLRRVWQRGAPGAQAAIRNLGHRVHSHLPGAQSAPCLLSFLCPWFWGFGFLFFSLMIGGPQEPNSEPRTMIASL